MTVFLSFSLIVAVLVTFLIGVTKINLRMEGFIVACSLRWDTVCHSEEGMMVEAEAWAQREVHAGTPFISLVVSLSP